MRELNKIKLKLIKALDDLLHSSWLQTLKQPLNTLFWMLFEFKP